LISFDTPKAVFPLKISAAGGKPSEVSLYIIAAEPLLSGFIYGQSIEKLGRQCAQWETEKSVREEQRRKMSENQNVLKLGFFLDSFYLKNPGVPTGERPRDYTREDLLALAREEAGTLPAENFGEVFYAETGKMLPCLRLTAEELPVCARSFTRLKKGEWYLTKQVHTFTPADMRDLEFEPALPALADTMNQPVGQVAAQVLAQLGPKAQAYLTRACGSTNSIQRLNAVIGIEQSRNPRFADTLPGLLKDQTPAIRLHTLRALDANPDSRCVDTIVGLLRDPERAVRMEASGYLYQKEPANRTPIYLALMQDPDPNIRMYALGIASWINRYAPSDDVYREALRLLKDPNEDVRSGALHALYQMHAKDLPRAEILPFLGSPDATVRGMAYAILRPGPPGPSRERVVVLSSAESAGLLTNRLTTTRLLGLKNLQGTGDAEAVELILPLLTDTNKLVRSAALFVLRQITGADVPENDPAKWQAWWKANKASFHPKQTVERDDK
jgi:hypothetical protein